MVVAVVGIVNAIVMTLGTADGCQRKKKRGSQKK